MLLVTASSNVARRLQAPWVSESEVQRVVEAWRAQGGRRESVIALDVPPAAAIDGRWTSDDDDEILARPRDLIIRTQSGSTSMCNASCASFRSAGRIMDQLEQEGVVAPATVPRPQVLVSPKSTTNRLAVVREQKIVRRRPSRS